MKTILIDTSSLLYAVKSKIDIFTELKKTGDFPFRVVVVEGTVTELKKLSIQGKERRPALLALALLKVKKIPIIPGKGNVDKVLVEYSQKGGMVVTQDRELKGRLPKPYLTIRQGKKIRMVR